MTDDRPIWLLDVDGVINAVCQGVPDGYRHTRVQGFEITWRPSLVDRLTSLHAAGAVEIRWLTTWLNLAATALAPTLSLPEWTVVGHAEYHTVRTIWWKTVTARQISDAEPDRPLIWTDDDLRYAERLGEVDWLTARTTPYLAISPHWKTGLTEEQLDLIEAFTRGERP